MSTMCGTWPLPGVLLLLGRVTLAPASTAVNCWVAQLANTLNYLGEALVGHCETSRSFVVSSSGQTSAGDQYQTQQLKSVHD